MPGFVKKTFPFCVGNWYRFWQHHELVATIGLRCTSVLGTTQIEVRLNGVAALAVHLCGNLRYRQIDQPPECEITHTHRSREQAIVIPAHRAWAPTGFLLEMHNNRYTLMLVLAHSKLICLNQEGDQFQIDMPSNVDVEPTSAPVEPSPMVLMQ